MRKQDLTQEERDCLLFGTEAAAAALHADSPHDTDAPAATHQLPAENQLQLRTVFKEQTRHFIQDLAQRLSQRLGTQVDGKVVRTDETTYGDCVARMDPPTCLEVIEIPPWEMRLLLELHPDFLFPLLNRLLGGGNLPPQRLRRGLTEIETRLVRKLSEVWLASLTAAWQPALEAIPRLERIESHPQRAQAGKPATPMWWAKLEVAFDDLRGSLQLAMPTSLLRGFSQNWCLQQAGSPDRVSVVATLGQPALDADQARALRVGDLVPCQAACDAPARVFVDGKLCFWAKPGRQQGRPAVQLLSRIDASADAA